MLTRILAVATALLAALVVNQYSTIGDLRNQMTDLQKRSVEQARAAAADSMEGQDAEFRRALEWLDAFYKSQDGLQRQEGLWIQGHPDFEGIGHWIFDLYLRRRLKGDTEEQARKAVEGEIKRSEEWRTKHRG